MPSAACARNQSGNVLYVSRKWGLYDVGISMSAAYADLDRDGDLDLVVSNVEEQAAVYRNDSASGHGVLLRLQGRRSNRFGLGASARVTTFDGEQVRRVSPMTGYSSSNEPLIHFGLADKQAIEELTVEWPSGHRQTFSRLAADRLYTIVEPDAASPQRGDRQPEPPLFQKSSVLAGANHREQPYNDFAQQPLLPHRMSQLGPGAAWADIDGDGDDDFFIGVAAGSAAAVWLNEEGSFRQIVSESLQSDRTYEDMGAVWFDADADADGDMDLYVAGGGVEHGDDLTLLRDRLYWNDGTGRLTKAAAEALPSYAESTGPVATADYDRDGDLDLFVGGRVTPGRFPMSPGSRIFRNNGGRLVDATPETAPSLRNSEMATGAIWSDVDADGWIDLLATHEWGPVRLLRNHQGQLVDRTEEAGLGDLLGWWNGIAGGDVDNDGDIDYAVTNLGRNTVYRAHLESPMHIYYGDFGGVREWTIVEAYYDERGVLRPWRDRTLTTLAVPRLSECFPTHESFGKATLEEIYSTESLDRATKRTLNTLDSGLLINNGQGRFEFRPLPRMAQTSPAFGVLFLDANADGNLDLFIAQNFFSLQPGIGRADGGLSLLLMGDGSGHFTPVEPSRSGVIIAGDAKSATRTDLDGDDRPDVVVGVNNGPVQTLINRSAPVGKALRAQLRGHPGNPTAVGARVTLYMNDETTQTAEVYAGHGYFSQSTAALTFGLGEDNRAVKVEMRWPDGTSSVASPNAGAAVVEIKQS